MPQRLRCLFACVVTALAVQSAAARADHPRPFAGAFEFTVVDVQTLSPTEVLVTGRLAGREPYLGRMKGQVVYVVDLVSGAFHGVLYKKAANGDLLFQMLSGQFTATGSEGEFVVIGGTGRFRHAGGGGTFIGVWTDPTLTAAHITFEGTLDF